MFEHRKQIKCALCKKAIKSGKAMEIRDNVFVCKDCAKSINILSRQLENDMKNPLIADTNKDNASFFDHLPDGFLDQNTLPVITDDGMVAMLNKMLNTSEDFMIGIDIPNMNKCCSIDQELLSQYTDENGQISKESFNQMMNDILANANDSAEEQNIEECLDENKESIDFTVVKPKDIKSKMDEYIIGQENAKIKMSIALYNHYKTMVQNEKNEQMTKEDENVDIQKNNIIMVGPTGCGKTLLAQVMAKIADVPFAIVDATNMTASGYVGGSVTDALKRLIIAAKGDIKKAEHGIVYIDEIDKLSSRGDVGGNISTESVQQELLKLIEDNKVTVPMNKNSFFGNNEVEIDTSNILFICGGAFDGLSDIIKKRTTGSKTIGFGSEVKSKDDEVDLANVAAEDFSKYGIIPELVGRLPVIVTLQNLEEKDLVHILTDPKNAVIKQYKKLFHMDGNELLFEEDSLQEIAHQAATNKTGARGLRTIVESSLEDLMYEAPSKGPGNTFVVTKEMVKNANPVSKT